MQLARRDCSLVYSVCETHILPPCVFLVKTARITITLSLIAVALAYHCGIQSRRPCQTPFTGERLLSRCLLILHNFTCLSVSECPVQIRHDTGANCGARRATKIHEGYQDTQSRYEIFGTYFAKASDFGEVQNFLSNRHPVSQENSAA